MQRRRQTNPQPSPLPGHALAHLAPDRQPSGGLTAYRNNLLPTGDAGGELRPDLSLIGRPGMRQRRGVVGDGLKQPVAIGIQQGGADDDEEGEEDPKKGHDVLLPLHLGRGGVVNGLDWQMILGVHSAIPAIQCNPIREFCNSRCSPAMEAGVTTSAWTVSDLAGMIEA
jgi:hypothetical protein